MIQNIFFTLAIAAAARHVEVKRDEVAVVKTAVGIATILQIVDQPTGVVLGDSSVFKVEYLNQAITIKPLKGGAMTNLYVNTDNDRFTVKLVTGPQREADYVVYLKSKRSDKPSSPNSPTQIKWKKLGVSQNSEFGKVTITRVGTAGARAFVDLEIRSAVETKIDPGAFWVRENSVTIPIDELILPSLTIPEKQPFRATLSFSKLGLRRTEPVKLELRGKKTVVFVLGSELL